MNKLHSKLKWTTIINRINKLLKMNKDKFHYYIEWNRYSKIFLLIEKRIYANPKGICKVYTKSGEESKQGKDFFIKWFLEHRKIYF